MGNWELILQEYASDPCHRHYSVVGLNGQRLVSADMAAELSYRLGRTTAGTRRDVHHVSSTPVVELAVIGDCRYQVVSASGVLEDDLVRSTLRPAHWHKVARRRQHWHLPNCELSVGLTTESLVPAGQGQGQLRQRRY